MKRGLLSPFRPARYSASLLAKRVVRHLSRMTSAPIFKFAGLQLHVTEDKDANIANAMNKVTEAAKNGANVVCLPEIWNSPYSNDAFPKYAETLTPGQSPSYKALAEAAKANKIYLIGGSVPERDGDKIYNTCLSFSPDGSLIGKYRKAHLFDIDIPGGITFQESKTLSPGQGICVLRTEYGRIGIGICYDMRFPELALRYALKEGCDMLVYPGAFNTTTGPKHWELLQRARAVDCQVWFAAVSPARNQESKYQAWGHTSVVSPWGNVAATTEHEPTIVYADVDMGEVQTIQKMRQQIPTREQKRPDLY